MNMLIPLKDRVIGALMYLLPWSKALPFGNEILSQSPILKILIIPTLPILYIERLVPFSNLIVYLLLFLGIIRNPTISYFVRFNTLQAILLNIFIIILTIAIHIFLIPIANIQVITSFSSFILILILAKNIILII